MTKKTETAWAIDRETGEIGEHTEAFLNAWPNRYKRVAPAAKRPPAKHPAAKQSKTKTPPARAASDVSAPSEALTEGGA